ncbi:hypothetical protein M4D49_27430 [Cupriavidus pauculus]|uniref:hypothetical protein n=2 Tax=Burkholderiales TaxID=80840 RepID=UPI00068C8696|nr:hypothetical protein [Cupriavidus pauculus]MCM3609222.1 hypothetical protein [Cupriavidus pauculus]
MSIQSMFRRTNTALSGATNRTLANCVRSSIVMRVLKAAALATLGVSQFAVAANIGKVAQNVSGSFNYIALAAQGFFGLCGIILIGMSIFTFIKHNKTEGQGAKLSTAFIYLIGGGVLFYIASLITTAGDTVWGDGGGDRGRVTIQQ